MSKSLRDDVQDNTNYRDVLQDILIVRKLDGTHRENKKSTDLQEEDEIEKLKQDENLLSEKFEAVLRKQLWEVQADQRGRQALANELADARKQQQQREEASHNRKKVLEVEKARAKRVASMPPPMPQSIKDLLKEQGHKELDKDSEFENFMCSEQNDEDSKFENKENLFDELEHRKLQEERNLRAKKRFNDALKKDREKQEQTDILQHIENAEKMKRRQRAKDVAEKGGLVPCSMPDMFFKTSKQASMEEAVENVCRKRSQSKEHAIEDIEGYEDKWEARYHQIDSSHGEKLVDCIPSFVKDNYSYLLEEERSEIPRRRTRFSAFDDEDIMNTGFYELPPLAHRHSDELSEIIHHLDQMRAESDEVYEKQFKPLLEAGELPKVALVDKSVEAQILKVPTENKEVTAKLSDIPCPNILMEGPSNQNESRDQSTRHEMQPHLSPLITTTGESWSSSSYFSVPSKHGLPNLCNLCESPSCILPLSEDAAVPITSYEPVTACLGTNNAKKMPKPLQSQKSVTSVSTTDSDNSQKSNGKESARSGRFTMYVKMLAEKHLKSLPRNQQIGMSVAEIPKYKSPKPPEPHTPSLRSSNPHSSEKLVADESEIQKHSPTKHSSRHPKTTVSEPEAGHSDSLNLASNPFERNLGSLRNNHPPHANKVKDISSPKNKSPVIDVLKEDKITISLGDANEDIVEQCYDIITSNVLNVFASQKMVEDVSGTCQSTQPRGRSRVYHDLSTIQEMDSGLSTDAQSVTRRSSKIKSNFEAAMSLIKKTPEYISTEEDKSNHSSASLLDIPPSEISEIAKKIQFVPKSPLKKHHEQKVESTLAPALSSSSSSLQTLSSFTLSGWTTPSTLTEAPSLFMTNGTQLSTPKVRMPSDGSFGFPTQSSAASSGKTPYSSSFKDSKLTLATGLFPRYFEDVSSIRQDNSNRPDHFQETPSRAQLLKFPDSRQPNMSTETFQPMTPHSDISRPSHFSNDLQNRPNSVFKHTQPSDPHGSKNSQFSSQSGSGFKPITSCSNISSLDSLNSRDLYAYSLKNSTKINSNHPKQQFMSSNLGVQAMTSHSDISSPSGSTPYKNMQTSIEQMRHQSSQDIDNYSLFGGKLDRFQPSCSLKRDKHNLSNFENSFTSKQIHSSILDKDINHVPSTSEYNPSKAVGSFGFSVNIDTPSQPGCNPLKSNVQSVAKMSGTEEDRFAGVAAENSASPVLGGSKGFSGKLSSDSPSPILEALRKESTASGEILQCQAPSSSSSAENLANMFSGDRIAQQSTPIKSPQEIFEEKLLMDMTDLTLVNTELTLKHVDFEKTSAPTTCDESPSMMSFLRHEEDCLQEREGCAIKQKLDFKPLEKVKTRAKAGSSKSPLPEYRLRTKRLWNNLEEVKNRKNIEIKKLEMARNRLKMKKYSKIRSRTPKKENPDN